MYSELIKWLWECASGECFNCSHKGNASCPDDLMKQAADAIEKLDAMAQTYLETIYEIEDKHKWIPVTERLPEDRQRVLAISLYKTRPRSSYYRLVYFSNNLESVDNFDFDGERRCGFYYYDSEYGFCEADDVTHWMPLPQPPESVES